eukprot:TRINITY_DN14527_c0_g1_i1.p2 TRINITY_DN14527_c0_g1~~TRINITY_DN14527_c0_g1_i1.p2  ORF type:complete len:334 (+),score=55.69 TRINITY_DN14527_c0_g1_i1:442-1443(+)
MALVLVPLLAHFGVEVECTLVRRGFFPKGGGELRVHVPRPITGAGLRPLRLLDPGTVQEVVGRAFAAGAREIQELPAMVAAAETVLSTALPGVRIHIEQVVETPATAAGTGSGITVAAVTTTGCRLGATVLRDPKQGLAPEDCGRQVSETLLRHLSTGSCVDPFTQDQLVVFMALAAGRSEVRIGELTDHTKLAIDTAKALLPCRFTVTPDGATNILQCDGAAITAPGNCGSSATSRGVEGSTASAGADADTAPKPTPPVVKVTAGPPPPPQKAHALANSGGKDAPQSSIADQWAARFGTGAPDPRPELNQKSSGKGKGRGKGTAKGKGHPRC